MSALGYHHRRRRELIRHNLQPSGGGLLPAKATDRPRLQVSEWRLARPASRFQPCRTSAHQNRAHRSKHLQRTRRWADNLSLPEDVQEVEECKGAATQRGHEGDRRLIHFALSQQQERRQCNEHQQGEKSPILPWVRSIVSDASDETFLLSLSEDEPPKTLIHEPWRGSSNNQSPAN